MSYSVFRIQGIKTTGDLKGLSKHNKDRVSHTNKDIDKAKSENNITLIECESYSQKFNQVVAPMREEHDERMKTMRADRVKTFDQAINSAKNDVAFEMVFTSDNDFFLDMSKEDITKWAEKSLDFVVNDLGIDKKNILHAVVHMDEKTPHLHVVAVPLVKTFSKKQNKDVLSISRRQFIHGKTHLSKIQDIYNERMNESGYKLERGEKGSNKAHMTKADYEKQKLVDIQKEVYKAKQELYKANKEIERATARLEPLKAEYEARIAFIEQSIKDSDVSVMYPDYAKISSKGLLHKEEFVTVPKDKWEAKHVSANQIGAIEKSFNKLEDGIEKIKNTDLSKKVDDLSKYKTKSIRDIQSLARERDKYQDLVEKYKTGIDRVNKTLRILPKEKSEEFMDIFKEVVKAEKSHSRGWDLER